jgi:hypothetical protein
MREVVFLSVEREVVSDYRRKCKNGCWRREEDGVRNWRELVVHRLRAHQDAAGGEGLRRQDDGQEPGSIL